MPFVWLVSAVGNSGMGQTSYVATAANGKKIPTFTMSQEGMLQQIGATRLDDRSCQSHYPQRGSPYAEDMEGIACL